MKTFLFLILSLYLINLSFCKSECDLRHLWEKFKKDHKKVYLSTEYEQYRMNIFRRSIEHIEKHNSEYSMGVHTYKLGINTFADWTVEEFRQKMLGARVNITAIKEISKFTFIKLPSEVKVPDSIDWREKNIVTEVKNQGTCGSCWAFSVTGSLESAHARKTGNLISLSEQQLVDCTRHTGNEGCDGGYIDRTFNYIQENGGIESEEDYPYTAEDGTCKFDVNNVAATCNGCVDVDANEDALKDAVASIGPVSVLIDASSEDLQYYSGGVYVDDSCGNEPKNLNHAVLAVGYGSEDDGDFWIVKNSWGTDWGESGYIRMARNKDNMCGIATAGTYPLVK